MHLFFLDSYEKLFFLSSCNFSSDLAFPTSILKTKIVMDRLSNCIYNTVHFFFVTLLFNVTVSLQKE